MADVVVVGSYNCDLMAYSERLPAPGETVIGDRFESGPGGKGANQAIGARRLGADVCFVTCIGDDAFGENARRVLVAEGLPERGIVTGREPTGVALILVDVEAQNAISVAPGANHELESQRVLDEFAPDLQECRFVVLQLECTTELAVEVATWGHDHGKCVILNPAPARPLPAESLPLFDILTPNEGELATIAAALGLPTASPDVHAAQLVALGVRNVIVTLGARGALWVSADGARRFKAYPVNAVDTTGAGDAFTSGLVAALARGDALDAAIDIGCRAGAFCVTHHGALDGLGALYSDGASPR